MKKASESNPSLLVIFFVSLFVVLVLRALDDFLGGFFGYDSGLIRHFSITLGQLFRHLI